MKSLQVVIIIPFENEVEKKWLKRKHKNCKQQKVEVFENYIVVEKLC